MSMFALRGAGIWGLMIAIAVGTTSCKQQAGRALLAGEVEAQAQRIAQLEEQLAKLTAQHQKKVSKHSAELKAQKELLKDIKETEDTLQTERVTAEAELKLQKENPVAPTDHIVLTNGQTVPGYIAEYANGVFTVAMPNGETKQGRPTSFKKIEFNGAAPADDS